jgi:hypothetical protein
LVCMSCDYKRKEASSSFLKKRTKKLLLIRGTR